MLRCYGELELSHTSHTGLPWPGIVLRCVWWQMRQDSVTRLRISLQRLTDPRKRPPPF